MSRIRTSSTKALRANTFLLLTLINQSDFEYTDTSTVFEALEGVKHLPDYSKLIKSFITTAQAQPNFTLEALINLCDKIK
jgi:hypothetical protein